MAVAAAGRRPFYESRLGFAACAAAIGLVAYLLRVLYSSHATVEAPVSGDATHYVAYAWNLLHHGVFSNVIPGSGMQVIPDAYRGPGYPALIYVALWAGEQGGDWYPLVLKIQAVLGALTAILTLLIGRRFLSVPLSILAALLVAVWPHLITISGYLLSETLFGFLLLSSLWLSCRAMESPRATARVVAAGAVSGFACLVNPIYLLFPWVMAALIWLKSERIAALLFLGAAMALPFAWSVRGATISEQAEKPSRLVQNFVQGSWPLYHAAYMSRDVDPVPRQILADVGREEKLLARDPAAGLRSMQRRMSPRPFDYLGWYVLDKVYLLWDWDIRIGQGDIYIIHTENSPIEKSPAWLTAKQAMHRLNPYIFWMSLLFAVKVLAGWLRRRAAENSTALVLALFFVYATGLHVVLQAEPRYSIPYRPVEILLALGFAAAVHGRVRARLDRING